MLSNSNRPGMVEPDIFFIEKYNGFKKILVPANRCINSDGNNRGPVNEILIMNYDYPV